MKQNIISISIGKDHKALMEYFSALSTKDILSKVIIEVLERHRLNEREQIEYDIELLEQQIEEKKKLLNELPNHEQIESIESFDRLSFKMLIQNLRMKGKDKEANKKIDAMIEKGCFSKEDGRNVYGRGNEV